MQRTPSYRAYPLNREGSIEGPAIPLSAGNDEQAVQEAFQRLGDHCFEVWNGKRRVIELRPFS